MSVDYLSGLDSFDDPRAGQSRTISRLNLHYPHGDFDLALLDKRCLPQCTRSTNHGGCDVHKETLLHQLPGNQRCIPRERIADQILDQQRALEGLSVPQTPSYIRSQKFIFPQYTHHAFTTELRHIRNQEPHILLTLTRKLTSNPHAHHYKLHSPSHPQILACKPPTQLSALTSPHTNPLPIPHLVKCCLHRPLRPSNLTIGASDKQGKASVDLHPIR